MNLKCRESYLFRYSWDTCIKFIQVLIIFSSVSQVYSSELSKLNELNLPKEISPVLQRLGILEIENWHHIFDLEENLVCYDGRNIIISNNKNNIRLAIMKYDKTNLKGYSYSSIDGALGLTHSLEEYSNFTGNWKNNKKFELNYGLGNIQIHKGRKKLRFQARYNGGSFPFEVQAHNQCRKILQPKVLSKKHNKNEPKRFSFRIYSTSNKYGTAFFVNYEKETFLITASHVLKGKDFLKIEGSENTNLINKSLLDKKTWTLWHDFPDEDLVVYKANKYFESEYILKPNSFGALKESVFALSPGETTKRIPIVSTTARYLTLLATPKKGTSGAPLVDEFGRVHGIYQKFELGGLKSHALKVERALYLIRNRPTPLISWSSDGERFFHTKNLQIKESKTKILSSQAEGGVGDGEGGVGDGEGGVGDGEGGVGDGEGGVGDGEGSKKALVCSNKKQNCISLQAIKIHKYITSRNTNAVVNNTIFFPQGNFDNSFYLNGIKTPLISTDSEDFRGYAKAVEELYKKDESFNWMSLIPFKEVKIVESSYSTYNINNKSLRSHYTYARGRISSSSSELNLNVKFLKGVIDPRSIRSVEAANLLENFYNRYEMSSAKVNIDEQSAKVSIRLAGGDTYDFYNEGSGLNRILVDNTEQHALILRLNPFTGHYSFTFFDVNNNIGVFKWELRN